MSDQQETDSDNGLRYPLDQFQEPQISVEVEDDMSEEEDESMAVKVTNIIDGIFKFAGTRSSSRSSIDGSETGSGRSSPSNTSNRRPNMSSMANTTNSSSAESFGSSRKKSTSTKKVQFKEQGGGPSRRRTPLQSSTQQLDSSSSSQPRGFASRRLSNDSQRSSNSNLDGSTSSMNSWEVNVEPEPGGTSVTKFNTSLSPTAAAALGPAMKKLQFGETPQSHAAAIAPRKRPQLGGPITDGPANPPQIIDSTSALEETDNMWFEKYMPHWVNRVREICGKIVTNDTFQLAMVLLIVANAVVMGVGTFDFISENDRLRNLFELIDYVFLIIFTIELALSFGYWGYQAFYDGWLIFDFVTIMLSWVLDGVQVFRSFRIFRSFRLIVRIPILRSLVYAVIHVLPRISSIMALFSLIIYIFAVMTTTLFKDYYERDLTDRDYFGRLDYSLFTLFQFVTLEGWGDIARQVIAVDYYATFIFGTFISISAFILYSLIVAVICDSFLIVEGQIRAEMKEQARLERERRKVLKRNKKRAKRDLFEESSNYDLDFADDEDGEPTNDEGGEPMHAANINALRGNRHPDVTGAVPGNRPWGNPSIGKPRPTLQSPASPGRSRPTLKSPGRETRSISPARSLSPAPYTPPRRLNAPAGPSDGERNEKQEDYSDSDRLLLDPLKFTETTSATATTVTHTLASGGLERKKRSGRKKRRPPKQRIARIQMKLDKMAQTQTDILATLDELCAQMDDEA